MSTFSSHPPASTTVTSESRRARIDGLGFDRIMVLLSTVFVGGLFLDGWAHNHGKVDESFFTPWHAFFYTGFLLTAAALLGAVLLNRSRGHRLAESIPTGYRSSMAGLFIFAAGGVGDLVWHTAFGIEDGIEALFSPTHLLLGVGIALIVTGPLRAAWRTKVQTSNWSTLGPALFSTSLLMSTLTFFMLFAHPVTQIISGRLHRHWSGDVGTVAGMLGMITISGLLVGPVLLLLRRWRLPVGSLTLMWGLNTVAMTIIDYDGPTQLWLGSAMLAAAILCDLIMLGFRPGVHRTTHLRVFAFAAPAILFGAYFAMLIATEGTLWSIHLWSGSIFLSGIVGLLLSYLMIPPVVPVDDEALK